MKFSSRDSGIPILTEIIDSPILARAETDAAEEKAAPSNQSSEEPSLQRLQSSQPDVINQTEMLEQMYTRFETVFGQQLQLLMTQAMQNAMDQVFAAVRFDIQEEQNRLATIAKDNLTQ